MATKHKASLSVIFVTIFIDLMGFGIIIPLLPGFALKLGMSDSQIGITVAIYSLMQFLFNPLLGKLSDKLGRRPLILVSLLFSVIAYLMFSFSSTFILLFLSRLIAGFGGSNIAVAQAYIADITTKEDRSKGMGIIGAAFGLGFVFGPVMGALLSKYGYAVAGYGSASLSMIAFLFALLKLPESIREKKTDTKIKLKLFDWKFTKKTLSHPDIGILVGLFFILIFSMAIIYATFPILGVKIYHFSDQDNGILFGIMGILGAAVQGGFMKQLSKYFGDRGLILFGSLSMMIGLACMPFGRNFLAATAILSFFAVGSAILQPALISMISKHSPESEQGAVLGLNNSFSAFARVLGPIWGGFSFDFLGYEFPFLTGAFFTLIAFLIIYFYLKPDKPKVLENV